MELKKEELFTQRNILLLGTALALLPLLMNLMLVETKFVSYDAKVNVTEKKNDSTVDLGLNAGRDMNFGEVPRGTNVTKKVKLESSGISLVTVRSTGNISEYLSYDRSFAFQDTKTINVEVNPSEPGRFSGEFKIKIQASKSEVGREWLELKSYFY